MENVLSFDIKRVIVDSTVDVFDMMLSLPIQFSEERKTLAGNGSLVLGSIDFMGDVTGIVNIQVTEKFARKMVSSMLDMEIDQIEGTEDIQDVLGEICNMVSGSLKSGLCDAGMVCELSTPAVIIGNDYNHQTRNMTRVEYFSFLFDDHLIMVDVGIKETNPDVSDAAIVGISQDQEDSDIFNYDMENSVINSVSEVFDMMLSMDVKPFGGQTGPIVSSRIIGSISFSGKVLGRLNLHIPEGLAKQMAGTLLGMEPNEIEGLDEVKDVVGELCNMVSGALKSDLCDKGFTCKVSPPSFTTGTDFEMELLNLTRHETFFFDYQNDIFMVEVGLKKSEEI
ncbi:MAG: chemotaxis protein CheX [Proteobacteria bacterium]|nr:chemotaxis protein CheX [Pseudomonadota bacterium]MBU4470533.1 chemotaxis protein CheX [Pseudomonadota bacterium]MCG2751369.1 chemotaxis protein CheX [Desulfobacteraceae bacterium]